MKIRFQQWRPQIETRKVAQRRGAALSQQPNFMTIISFSVILWDTAGHYHHQIAEAGLGRRHTNTPWLFHKAPLHTVVVWLPCHRPEQIQRVQAQVSYAWAFMQTCTQGRYFCEPSTLHILSSLSSHMNNTYKSWKVFLWTAHAPYTILTHKQHCSQTTLA